MAAASIQTTLSPDEHLRAIRGWMAVALDHGCAFQRGLRDSPEVGPLAAPLAELQALALEYIKLQCDGLALLDWQLGPRDRPMPTDLLPPARQEPVLVAEVPDVTKKKPVRGDMNRPTETWRPPPRVASGDETADRIANWPGPLSVRDLAKVTKLSKKKIYSMVRRGTLPRHLVDGALKFDPAVTAAWWRSTAA